MKIYGIIESFQDYQGADATNWGVKKTLEQALSALKEIIEQHFHYIRESIFDDVTEELGLDEMPENDEELSKKVESRWQEWFDKHLDKDGDTYSYKWEYDDGDSVYKYYIDEIDFEM